ncbi:M14 family zinc carboxypeptidase, partial [uncultured Algibacter sp.]|uniref:M14 family zinc carboxypeptidase n=1 Tax=uncultured Algibacter sp. TaxID=298659 RepID=UPI00261A734E
MKKITLLSVILMLVTQLTYSQNIITKRIKINNPTRDQLFKVKDVGIDLSCGAIFKDDNLILELGETELNKLDIEGITYTVLIDDLIGYYKKKTETELPIAKANLEAKKNKYKLASKSLSTKSESIDNFIQYEGCTEVDWAIPTNFKLGSMMGCLTYSEVLDELDLMRTLYPNLISVKANASPTNQLTYGNSETDGGTYDSWSGSTIYYVRISDNPDIDEPNEPESLYSGMTHSREVSSMMNLMYYMWYVLENYNSDPGIKNLVDNHEMYFIPVANPDGLRWNEQIAPSGGGMQRKNLGPYNTGINDVRGVDLNRNYDYFWGSSAIYGGSSGTQNNNTYRGPSAFSEPETQIVRDFSATRNFKTAMNHHATSNLIPHAYNGYPGAPASGREAEYHKFCHDMTRFNRYIYGEAPDILTIANGDMSDWMLGGAADVNGSTGSGQGILALAPENGAWDGSEGGFWPDPLNGEIEDIARRAIRMNFVNAYHSGKFAQFHDLNPSNINSTSGNLEFGLEYLGQTLGNITLNVTPVSANITSITPPPTQTGWSKLEQRTVTAAYTLDAGIQPNDEIEFQITLSNDDGYVMYRANIIKIFEPTIIMIDNPDEVGMVNWTASGGSWGTTADSYSGSTAITDSPSGPYENNISTTLTLNTDVDLSPSTAVVVQFFAKWDLERNFDYVQIEGSTNGSTWLPLCGKYTKPGSDYLTNRYSSGNSSNNSDASRTSTTNQPSGEMLYDADTMDKWVMEEILIDATENSFLFGATNARFRFVLDSDNTNRADGYPTTFDGFTFDDFKIISNTLITCNDSSAPSNLGTSNITADSAVATWDIVPSATYDIRYKEVSSGTWIETTNISDNFYNLSGLSENTDYEVQVSTRCSTSTSSYSSSSTFTTLDPCPNGSVSDFTTDYNQNWDSGIGNWSQDPNDDITSESISAFWAQNTGGTPSGNTGPSDDFNTGGNYYYAEASTPPGTNRIGQNINVNLISPCFDLSNYENANFSFYYHMYGADMGTLSVDISTDSGVSWNQLDAFGNTVINTPILSGQQQGSNAAAWLQQNIDLSNYDGQTFILRFSATTGSGFNSDIAIDEINLSADFVSTFTPVASCQNINATLDATGNVTIVADDIDDGTSIGNLSIDISSFTCAEIGTNNVTLTATDPSDSGNTDTCIAVVTVIQQDAPTPTNCWDNYVYNSTSCIWENQGSQPAEPATACYETATFNTTSCMWEVTGSQPAEPATACYETATFNTTSCMWEVT